MPRARIDPQWEKRIRIIRENNKLKASAPFVHRELGRQPAPCAGPMPSERTVGRYLAEIAEEEKENPNKNIIYRYFSWPDSMGTPDLPWEASRVCFELMSWLEKGNPKAAPLTVDEATWFWRVSLLAPEAPTPIRFVIALRMTMGAPHVADLSALAYRPWASRKLYDAYRKGIASGSIKPLLPNRKGGDIGHDFWTNERTQYITILGIRFGADMATKYPGQIDKLSEYLDELEARHNNQRRRK